MSGTQEDIERRQRVRRTPRDAPPPRWDAYLSKDFWRVAVCRLPLEDYQSTDELRAWPIKQLIAELRCAPARAPLGCMEAEQPQPPLEKSELIGAVQIARGGEAARACAICTEDFSSGDTMRVLQCGHRFHVECVDRWLLGDSRPRPCPTCRTPLVG